jgi:hypothetical protein
MNQGHAVRFGASEPRSSIDAERLMTTARYASGELGPIEPDLVVRVRKLVDWINAQGPIVPWRLEQAEQQLRNLLTVRLRLTADRARVPQIAQERIERPIFVIGFARTGTTLIHSLLAQAPGARAPMWWHTHAPSPPPGEVPVAEARIEFAAKELDELLSIAPSLLMLHPYWDKRGHALIEDEEIFALDFQNAYPTFFYKVPTLSMALEAASPSEAYAFQRRLLQHLQWNTGPGHWVLKGTYHQFALDALLKAYPDAVCIWPHREPAEVWPSVLAIAAVLYGGITDWNLDPATLGPSMLEDLERALAEVAKSPLVDDPRIAHLDFRELTRDPVAAIRAAYRRWDRPFPEGFEDAIRTWLADPANRSDRHGRYAHAPEHFGLTREMLLDACKPYRERFGLPRPSR